MVFSWLVNVNLNRFFHHPHAPDAPGPQILPSSAPRWWLFWRDVVAPHLHPAARAWERGFFWAHVDSSWCLEKSCLNIDFQRFWLDFECWKFQEHHQGKFRSETPDKLSIDGKRGGKSQRRERKKKEDQRREKKLEEKSCRCAKR